MDKAPFFSIIIPTYNSADKLKNALDSVMQQTFKDFEVIVCDDGSTDHTREVVNGFSSRLNIKYLWGEHWGGPARPRNNGIKAAQGDYIAFLDADDQWYANKLEISKRFLSDADVVFHDFDIYTPRGRTRFKKIKGRYLRRPVFVDLMRNENALTNSGVVVRKSILEEVGGLNEGFLTCVEDFDLWLKISRVTEKFTYIPKTLGIYWLGSGKVSEPSERIAERTEFVYNKYFNFLKDEDRRQSEAVLCYLLGRIKRIMGLEKEALKFFKISVKSKNLKFKIRSIYWILLLNCFIKARMLKNAFWSFG